MSIADALMMAGMLTGGLSLVGLGLAMLAATRNDRWMDGYQAGKASMCNHAPQSPQPPAPIIVLTQPPAQPAQPQVIDAAWRPVQPERRFMVVGEPEQRRQLR